MKKIIALFSGLLVAGVLAAQTIPENRDLYVGVWKFAEENNYQNVSKYSKQIEKFLKKEILTDAKIDARTGETSYEKSFDFEKGNSLDLADDEYRILTTQIDKVLMSYTLHIFDWTIKNDNGSISLKLNNSLTSTVDKNGNWTSSSKFQKAKILNGKQIEKMATDDVMKYLTVSDEEYAKNKKEVSSNIDFLISVVPNMTELMLEDFINENDLFNIDTEISLNVFDVSKNNMEVAGYTPDVYTYKIYGTNGNAYLWGFSNSPVFNKAKKDSAFSCTGKIKQIKYKMLKTTIYFVVE